MKIFLSVFLALALSFSSVWAAKTPTQGTFISVKGKVQVNKVGGKSRNVHEGSTVKEGDRIVTGKNSSAVVRLFDGSELSLSADSRIGLTKLQKPTEVDKVMKFKLFFGKLISKVKKLASSDSSFEVESGGVVCGVRGTEYSMFYNPQTGKMDVLVLEGTVWANSGGQTFIYHQGEGGTFTHGHPDHHNNPPGHSNGSSNGSTNGPTQGFISSNPFYGFDGNGNDPFNGLLTDLTGGVGDVTGQTGDSGIAGLGRGGPGILSLQLNFPQYPPDLPVGLPSLR